MATFQECAELTFVRRDDQAPIDLTEDEEDAMLCGIASIKAGTGIPLADCRASLRRL